MKTASLLIILGIFASAGCDASPTAPSPAPPPVPAGGPVIPPAGSTGPLAIAAVEPGTGATGGTTTVRITGTGFQAGSTVTFGGAPGSAWGFTGTSLWVTTPVHAAATVDVVIIRPNGDTATLAGAYTFVAASAFDFNGIWQGEALAHPDLAGRSGPLHEDTEVRFTIQDNVLTSFSCGGSPIPVLSPARVVSDGEFSLAPNGVEVSGRIVSATGAVGTINTIACPATRWTAMKR